MAARTHTSRFARSFRRGLRRARGGPAVSSAIERYRDGEPGAAEDVFRQYGGPALAMARSMLPVATAAAAVARDGLLDALRAPAGAFSGRANEMSVVMGFVRRRCLGTLRPGPESAAAPDADTRWQAVMSGLAPATVRDAVLALPRDERAVLLPTYTRFRPLAAVAAELGIDDETARRHLRLALQHLRDAVSDSVESGLP